MLDSLPELYSMSDGTTKKKIPGCIFTEKLILETRSKATKFRAAEKERKRGRKDEGEMGRKKCVNVSE